ncbi:MAG: gluconate 2-dehydrogenase subunit 3 family protein [Bryobacteraceae bacterium]|nr:gluconate 2-dehydrogenase subunit 3 family protein [Bryobacteraceae bacterium]MCX7603666.1 gluconate 2-dehydrogenase subunit 3 family protein [Bryobacteraceae bacterium]
MIPSSQIGGGSLKRRTFLASSAAAAAAGCGRKPAAAPGYRFLTPEEADTLGAWVDTLIPPDEDPGAREAGVVHYIDIQLTRWFRKHQSDYRAALSAIDRWSWSRRGRAFALLPLAEREELLVQMEKGKAPRDLFPDGGRAAFDLVLAHAMQGFYGNPRHGGNRGYASWKMIGVPPMPVRGREHYSAAETFPERS